MSITIEKFLIIGPKEIELIYPLYCKLFDPAHPIDTLIERCREKEKYLLLVAMSNGSPVGLKAAMAEDNLLHSWIGGVLPEFRRQGIARQLTEIQHEWAKENGFSRIRTHTDHRYNNMIIHNIRNGFEIIETKIRPHNGVRKIVMVKEL
ncbi:MAG: hypothetical protein BM556_05860 [Bacteriovorax sp. MedPE-SWde]|nr:MAG: hypothetical protein BM556_05860 [Bacteriovorax sp. MedPE-SWde]